MILATPRLRLRPFTRDDVDALHAIWTDPDVRRYLWDDIVITRETAVDVVEGSLRSFAEAGYGFWCIEPLDETRVIGFCGLRKFADPPEIELLYGLHREFWGRGLASEASREVLRYAFETLALARIFAGADRPNAASFRVMERLGMRRSDFTRSDAPSAIYFRIDPDDWMKSTIS